MRVFVTTATHLQINQINKNYRIFINHFKFSMEHLNRLIKDASNQFQCHNFQTSLSLYVRCIDKCESQNLPKYVLHNLKSSQAALRTILGDYEAALKVLNQVLAEDKQHWLSLIRRSQVYKKQTKYKKAMKDLDILTMYAPDNMQVVALKLELKGYMSKTNQSSSQSQEDQDNVDQQQVLKFSNLKRIDRTSVSIMVPKGRQSRVTISGDKSFFYESNNDNKEKARESKSYTPTFNCKRFIEIDKELEQTVNSEKELPVAVIKAKPTRTKSILKNRDSKLFVQSKPIDLDLDPHIHEQQQKLLSKIQDIDGRMISSVTKIQSSIAGSQRQVNFRKSSFMEQPQVFDQIKIEPKSKAKSSGRKSCLKNTSFCAVLEETQKKAGPRRSKFETMSRNSIDGKILKGDKKKKQTDVEASKQNINRRTSVGHNNQSDNQSQEGSQFNIFGSKKVVLNQQLRENLGLGSDSIVEDSQPKIMKQKPARGVSILKTTSIVVKKDVTKKKASVFFKESEGQKEKPERKAKKSVMFRAD